MPFLGDYLGQLLSEITMARMQADLETVRLAEIYASHPLLRALPVPHVRLPDVDLDMPVIVRESEPPRPGESPRGGIPFPRLPSQFMEVLTAQITRRGLDLPAAESAALAAALEARLDAHAQPSEAAVDVNRIADDFVEVTAKILGEKRLEGPLGGALTNASLVNELKEAARLAFVKLRSAPPRLTVAVTTSEIREAGPSEILTRLRLKISEQGLEWTSIESEGGRRDRLVPE